ncbi:MAG TPA: ribosome biogenesis GTPase Der [Kiritimatiellia bacterium]|nr:ribosome biogenesis GTPase Der [Kiritimatiellia bacterium]HMO99868.1 ribosome biogenesis GTPase Der [Kiritimatiellia bacterium]HMP96739.1 ribosome biogenesis GTPase Der [Kiritimatiellia bacterium]
MTRLFSKRIVAIVGRPNVGKSAMFNRMVRRRISIVHEQAGVTRDRVSAEAVWKDQAFELIDTGGLGFIDREGTGDEIEHNLREQALTAVEDAALILFAVDVTAGVTPLDQEVARLLHASGRPVLLAANKCDNDRVEKAADEFLALGFPVYPVAALHDRGFDRLLDDVLARLPEEEPSEQEDVLKVAVVGKPNAGKSSFINRLIRAKRLIVSDLPGTTRDSVEIPFTLGTGPSSRHYRLIDTAGLRHIRREHSAVELFSIMRAKNSIEAADVVVLMMDAEVGPTEQDKKIAALINEHQKGCILAVNKWDLAEGRVEQEDYLQAMRKVMPFMNFAPVIFLSAVSGLNVKKCLRAIDAVGANINMTLTTGMLNRVLHKAADRLPAPNVSGKRFKLYYATQIGTRPIRINIFANEPKALTPPYRLYLLNQLRAAYGLEGAPLILAFKSSHGDAEHDEKRIKKRPPRAGKKRPTRRPR